MHIWKPRQNNTTHTYLQKLPLRTPFNHTIYQDLAECYRTWWRKACVSNKGTRLLDALPLRTKDLAVTHMLRWCALFNAPSVLHTDNGLEFCNKKYQELCTSRSIHHSTGAPHTPSSQGRVERMKVTMKKVLDELRLPSFTWPSLLFGVVEQYNRTVIAC
eukprot:GHVR01138167.1.p1 GENE.GHVR01138167.1~~GHVR01138167.1.p1  ORF type:complete len:160 (-),score=9.03 GHVR01138167.1:722-1201(-)